MLFVRLLGLISLSLVLGACSGGLSISQHKTDHSSDLATLSTYSWASNKPFSGTEETAGHHRDFDALVRAGVDQALVSKGFRKVKDNADFSVDYRIHIQEEVVATDTAYSDSQNDQNPNLYGPRWKIGGGNGGYEGISSPEEELIFLQKGRLHIGAFNPQGDLVWHVSADKLLKSQKTDVERQQVIRAAVDKIMAKFPRR